MNSEHGSTDYNEWYHAERERELIEMFNTHYETGRLIGRTEMLTSIGIECNHIVTPPAKVAELEEKFGACPF